MGPVLEQPFVVVQQFVQESGFEWANLAPEGQLFCAHYRPNGVDLDTTHIAHRLEIGLFAVAQAAQGMMIQPLSVNYQATGCAQ